MKKILLLISSLLLLTSCDNEPVDFYPINNNDYSVALDTLANYDNYFIGEFNGELFVSTERFTVGGAVGNTLLDSVSMKYTYAYRISNSEDLKTPFISFHLYESKSKLNPNNFLQYNDYSDFQNYFNYNELDYWEVDNFKNLTTQVSIRYIDYSQLINNSGISYQSTDFGKPPFDENNFQIESIREIENPSVGIELTYSFNCTLLSGSNEVIEIENGRGKCTFLY